MQQTTYEFAVLTTPKLLAEFISLNQRMERAVENTTEEDIRDLDRCIKAGWARILKHEPESADHKALLLTFLLDKAVEQAGHGGDCTPIKKRILELVGDAQGQLGKRVEPSAWLRRQIRLPGPIAKTANRILNHMRSDRRTRLPVDAGESAAQRHYASRATDSW